MIPVVVLGLALYRFKQNCVLQNQPQQKTILMHWVLAVLAVPSYCLCTLFYSGTAMLVIHTIAYQLLLLQQIMICVVFYRNCKLVKNLTSAAAAQDNEVDDEQAESR